jgi:thioredoxin-like negative regulator of GroEL
MPEATPPSPAPSDDESLRRDKAMLLFFYSPTSGPSRRMEGLVSGLYVRERKRLRLQTIDVNDRTDIVERLGITTVPTVLLVKGRRVVAQLAGRCTGEQLRDAMVPHIRA